MQQVAEMVQEVGIEVNPNEKDEPHEGLKRVYVPKVEQAKSEKLQNEVERIKSEVDVLKSEVGQM
jgi:hypothetical protein